MILLSGDSGGAVIEPRTCFHALDDNSRLNSDIMAVALHIGSEASGEGLWWSGMVVGM